jgi:hypothetical protein
MRELAVPANEVLQFSNSPAEDKNAAFEKLRGFGTSRWQLCDQATNFLRQMK